MLYFFHISDAEEKKVVDNETGDDLNSKVKIDPIEKYKALLKSIEDEEIKTKKEDVELEVTWDVGATEKIEKLVKEKIKSNEELTPFEQYLEKRKAKKNAKRQKNLKKESQKNDSEDSMLSDIDMNDKYFAEELKNGKSLSHKKEKKSDEDSNVSSNQEEDRRKAELELLLMDHDEDGGKKHFNMKEIEKNATLSKSKRKRLSKKKNAQEKTKEDDFEVDVQDPRFAALFTSHNFNIDPADPHYRKTKGTEALVNEKLKRRVDIMASIEDVSKIRINSIMFSLIAIFVHLFAYWKFYLLNDLKMQSEQSKKPRTSEELSTELQALVKSVKRKTQNITQSIKG